jgi:hypothetical protein
LVPEAPDQVSLCWYRGRQGSGRGSLPNLIFLQWLRRMTSVCIVRIQGKSPLLTGSFGEWLGGAPCYELNRGTGFASELIYILMELDIAVSLAACASTLTIWLMLLPSTRYAVKAKHPITARDPFLKYLGFFLNCKTCGHRMLEHMPRHYSGHALRTTRACCPIHKS